MANSDSIQQYIDSLKADLETTNDVLSHAQKTEEQQLNLLDKTKSWSAFLQKTLGQLTQTDQLALAYTNVLGRTVKQASKVAGNSWIGLKALKILICQIKEVSDCTEMLRILTGQLKDRINIPAKDGVIVTDITNLQKAVDDALAAIKIAIAALLTAYQLQEDIFKSIDGNNDDDRGMVKQLTWMQMQVLYGFNADPYLNDHCANCKKESPLFPMENNRKFYQDVKRLHDAVAKEIVTLSKTAITDTCEREIKQAKRDALQAALTAAEAAKSCDTKK